MSQQLSVPSIPDGEFAQRIERAQALIRQHDLDALLVNSHEADFANVRYFSDYWPLFEIAGVLIPAEGAPALLVGPESGEFAKDRSRIPNIHTMLEYRESADPAYPGVPVSTFPQAFASVGVARPRRIGIGGYLVTTAPVLDSLKQNFPDAELTRADAIMVQLRSIKSPAELTCMRRAFEIVDKATEAVLETIKPGMTELQVVGTAQRVIYENGAEYEGLPHYVLSGPHTRHAISRATYRVMQPDEMVQLNLSARVAGYSASIGVPICLGTMTPRMKELVDFGLEAHHQTIGWLKAGVVASDVAKRHRQFVVERGYGDNYLYGPCHGTGMMEVEPPWMEETSDYTLQENMTFQIDTFLCDTAFGLRWENGVCITADGVDMLSSRFQTPVAIG